MPLRPKVARSAVEINHMVSAFQGYLERHSRGCEAGSLLPRPSVALLADYKNMHRCLIQTSTLREADHAAFQLCKLAALLPRNLMLQAHVEWLGGEGGEHSCDCQGVELAWPPRTTTSAFLKVVPM